MAAGDHVRLASPDDAARIAEIYNQGIQDRIATFETEERTVETVRSWFAQPYPIAVVERAGEVVAWANASQYRSRACYAGICEFSVYVAREARHTGAGHLAMDGLIYAASSQGFHKLVSRVFPENSASRRLLERLGFREVGVYHRHGQLDGNWRDVVIVERLLKPPSSDGWMPLHSGQRATIIKTHQHDDSSDWTYSGIIIPSEKQNWIAVEAEWTLPDTDVEGVRFITGGKLVEFFSATNRFNVFQVFGPDGAFTGIYANVTAPTSLTRDEVGQPLLTWEDHWLDVVRLPDGTIKVLDEDEYQDAGIEQSHPELHQTIQGALSDLIEQLSLGEWDS